MKATLEERVLVIEHDLVDIKTDIWWIKWIATGGLTAVLGFLVANTFLLINLLRAVQR